MKRFLSRLVESLKSPRQSSRPLAEKQRVRLEIENLERRELMSTTSIGQVFPKNFVWKATAASPANPNNYRVFNGYRETWGTGYREGKLTRDSRGDHAWTHVYNNSGVDAEFQDYVVKMDFSPLPKVIRPGQSFQITVTTTISGAGHSFKYGYRNTPLVQGLGNPSSPSYYGVWCDARPDHVPVGVNADLGSETVTYSITAPTAGQFAKVKAPTCMPPIFSVRLGGGEGDLNGNLFAYKFAAVSAVPHVAPRFITPTGIIHTRIPTFSWTPVAGAVSYVLSVSNTPVVRVNSSVHSYTLSKALQRGYQGATIMALFGDGLSASSGTHFTVQIPMTLTWTGRGDGQHWSDARNWNGRDTPQSGDVLVFPGGAPTQTVNDEGGLSLKRIDITGAGYNLTGNGITLTAGLQNTGGDNTYGLGTRIVGANVFHVSKGTLDITSALTGEGSITIVAGPTATTPTVIDTSDPTSAARPTVKFEKESPNFRGAVTVKSGEVLELDNAKAAGIGTITLEDGATLKNGKSEELILSSAVTFKGTCTVDTYRGGITFDGNVTVAGANGCSELTSVRGAKQITFSANSSLNGNALYLRFLGEVKVTLRGTLNCSISIHWGCHLVLASTVKGSSKIDVEDGGILESHDSLLGFHGNILVRGEGVVQLTASASRMLGDGELEFRGGWITGGTGAGHSDAEIRGLDNVVNLGGYFSVTNCAVRFSKKVLSTDGCFATLVESHLRFADGIARPDSDYRVYFRGDDSSAVTYKSGHPTYFIDYFESFNFQVVVYC